MDEYDDDNLNQNEGDGDENDDKNDADGVDQNHEVFPKVIKLADLSDKSLVVCVFWKRFGDSPAEILLNFQQLLNQLQNGQNSRDPKNVTVSQT